MKLQILIFAGYFLHVFALNAQDYNFGTGAIIDSSAFSKVSRMPDYTGTKTKRGKWRYSLRPYSPIPGHQGSSNTCVGWATGYSAMSIHHAILTQNTDRKDITQNAFSPYFIFNQIKESDCRGALITEAMDLIKEKGDCRYQTFKSTVHNCDTIPGKLAFLEADQFKIKDYAALFQSMDDAYTKQQKTIQAISHDNPVIVIMCVTNSLQQVKIGQKVWAPSYSESTGMLAHAMVVTGYNKRLKQFELMNSWGPNWGDEGFIWVSFEDFARLAQFGFQLLPDAWAPVSQIYNNTNTDASSRFSISASLNIVVPPDTAEYLVASSYSETKKVMYDLTNQSYRPISDTWQLFSTFKFRVENLSKGAYFYLFSLTPDGTIEYLYPLAKDQNTGNRLAHFMAGDSLQVTYPPGDEGLWLETPGKDHVVALFSWRAVENASKKIKQMEDMSGTLPDRLTQLFGDELVPLNQIPYYLDNMGFNINFPLSKGNKIIPLILTFNVRP